MSYREIRNFTEIMRSLGYPRLISMENFRNPNFQLVADILYWMVKLYDPEAQLSDDVEFEEERINFLTKAASLLSAKARLKLNTKKLYASDGRAVQELLKLANVLYKATRTVDEKAIDEAVPAAIRVQDVKSARTLATEITASGAKLYDLLANEKEERGERARAIRFLETSASSSDGNSTSFVERSIKELIENAKQSLEDTKKETEELEADERNMENKIRKKQEELERTEKRLKSLESVKPQFMEETERLEKELQRYYEIYMDKHRNLDYLEFELDKYHRNEEERKLEHEQKLQKMRERLYRDEVDLMRGGNGRDSNTNDFYSSNINGSSSSNNNGNNNSNNGSGSNNNNSNKKSNMQDGYDSKGGVNLMVQGRNNANVQGSMARNVDDDDESSDGSRDSADGSDDEDSMEQDQYEPVRGKGGAGQGVGGGRRSNEDDDFVGDDDDEDDGEDGAGHGYDSGDNSEEDF